MRQFYLKIFICVAPVLLALWAIWYAYENDRFKLGVDLSGGTILVYEIDLRKQQEQQAKEGGGPQGDPGNLLAEALKRRVDPNDLKNIIIRPAGEGRVEIIIPTGGVERAQKAEEQWNKLLQDMQLKYHVTKLDVPRGRTHELAERIQQVVSERAWASKLYSTPKELKELEEKANENLLPLVRVRAAQAKEQERLEEAWKLGVIGRAVGGPLAALPLPPPPLEMPALAPYKAKNLTDLMKEVKARINDFSKDREVDLWFRQQAWEDTIARLYPYSAREQLAAALKGFLGDSSKDKEVDAWLGEKETQRLLERAVNVATDPKAPADVQAAVLKKWPDLEKKKAELDAYFDGWPTLARRKAEFLTIFALPGTDPKDKDIAQAIELQEKAKRLGEFYNISPDSLDELVGRAAVGGDAIAQSVLTTLAPLVGELPLSEGGADQKDRIKSRFLDREKIRNFVVEHFGPSLKSIEEVIQKSNEASGRKTDLGVEEVQYLKEQIAKVGSLEFRMLANSYDDEAAIADNRALLDSTDPEVRAKVEEAQLKGLPPPVLMTNRLEGKPKAYDLGKLSRGAKSRVTYSWVELGPQERRQLGLDNAARYEAGRSSTWYEMARARGDGVKNPKATTLDIPFDPNKRKLLQGALFYSRACLDRNLPEEERRKKQFEYFVLARNPEIDLNTGQPTPKVDGSYLVHAYSNLQEGRPSVSFVFNNYGGSLFRELTRKNVPSGTGDEASQVRRHLAIILDGLVMSAPTINSEISTHGQITGSFTAREVDQLVNILRSGALPATLKTQPVSESTMAPTLGQDTIRMGVRAVGVAFLAVIVFMIIYYRFAGLVASIALLANLVLTVGFMVAVQATFTLPGLAGLVLMMGMAVDANVLIYERLREERERGASLALALRNGYERALPTILDTHLTSIFTSIVLYIVGNDQLKGFGVTLTAGLIISLFTSLYVTRVIFDIWLHKGWLKKLSMFKLFSRPDIDFMGIRYYWFTATVLLTILGVAVFIGRLPQDLNIDFVGGTAYAGQLREAKDIEGLRTLLDDKRQKVLLTAQAEEVDPQENRYRIVYKEADGSLSRPREVLLANRPEGLTPHERAENVQARASVLPDWSVEQFFPSDQKEPPGMSRYFNVRTSEKEPELVQVTLDRLLQKEETDPKTGKKEWASLLKKVEMRPEIKQLEGGGLEVKLHFTEPAPEGGQPVPHFASQSFVKSLLTRELLREYGKKELVELPFQMEMIGEGRGKEGRFDTMKLIFGAVSGKLPREDVAKITAALNRTQGAFAQRPQPERLETFDSQLAAETRLRAMYAILLSWAAILCFLWFRFGSWTFGLAAVICLIHDLCFTLGIIAFCHYVHATWFGQLLGLEDFKVDLTAVAALLTLVGYSVNDTIVVFDRIREVRGKNPDLTPQMINDSVNQTLSRTILASLTTWLVVLVLYIWGGPGVKLFAFVMVVGVIVGTYSSIYIASPLLLIFGEGSRATAKAREREREPQPTGGTDVRIQPAQ